MLPREKLSKWGIASLSFSELIAVILGTDGRRGVINVSKEIERLFKAGNITKEALEKIDGVGSVKAMKLLCSMELGYRLSCSNKEVERIDTTQKAYEKLKKISNYKQEHLLAIFLNARYEVVDEKLIALGTFDRLQVLPRDLIISALEVNGAYIVLGHNHPSGDCSPSPEDIEMTKRFKKALEIVGITLLDHLVISKQSFASIDLG